MPIQIIPKEAAKLPLWQNIFFYISIASILVVVLTFGVFTQLSKNSSKILEEKGKLFEANKTPEILALEGSIKNYRDKIDAFSVLLSSHKLGTHFFSFLDKATHPNVFYNGMDLDLGNNKVSLLGETDSFAFLAQQIMILKKEDMVDSLQLSKIEITKEGKVAFGLDIILNPEMFSIEESANNF